MHLHAYVLADGIKEFDVSPSKTRVVNKAFDLRGAAARATIPADVWSVIDEQISLSDTSRIMVDDTGGSTLRYPGALNRNTFVVLMAKDKDTMTRSLASLGNRAIEFAGSQLCFAARSLTGGSRKISRFQRFTGVVGNLGTILSTSSGVGLTLSKLNLDKLRERAFYVVLGVDSALHNVESVKVIAGQHNVTYGTLGTLVGNTSTREMSGRSGGRDGGIF